MLDIKELYIKVRWFIIKVLIILAIAIITMLIIILTTIKFRVKKVAPKTNKKPTKLTLSKATMIKIIKKAILLTLLLFIPILQFYPTLIALPLFLFPEINKSMAWIFVYFYPNSFLTIIIFVIYYFLVFYLYEFFKKWYGSW